MGCGEGRISCLLKDLGYCVTASDPVMQLVQAANDANSADFYEVATAANLPFEDARFDLVVAYNVLMDIEDVPTALKEPKRVLRPASPSPQGCHDEHHLHELNALEQNCFRNTIFERFYHGNRRQVCTYSELCCPSGHTKSVGPGKPRLRDIVYRSYGGD